MTDAPTGEASTARAGAPSPEVAAMLAERYGRRPGQDRRSRRSTRIVAIVCAILGIAVLVLIGTNVLRPAATAQDVGFAVLDDSQVRVTFDVTKPDDRSATCTLEALNTGFGQVGLLEVVIPPAEGPTTRHTATVATTELATTGVVRDCELLD
ncbi:DUF4307 domain-containing protein [Ruania alba]|uniref:DUF4307 domain-containing protein n=1 Tax=Ruania alba TaxID=648782 RepID=A0A1H5N4J9_9MICO|nr:DUF4307 domain-containing protein [Ruania alba]SEE96525.1 protein of unknown function [Ruania alba]